jgi:hypothetical protein
MGVLMKKILLIFFCFVFVLGCASRSLNQYIANDLQPSALRYSFGTQPINLKAQSKCNTTDVLVINTEQRTGDIDAGHGGGINPQELTGQIVDYIKDAYRQSRVVADPKSKKIINVSLSRINVISRFNSTATLELLVNLPEKKTTEKISAVQSTGDYHRAIVYAIHDISWQIVNDPVIQDYILCR